MNNENNASDSSIPFESLNEEPIDVTIDEPSKPSRCNCIATLKSRYSNYVRQMKHAFGTQFLILLFLVQGLLKGLLMTLTMGSMMPLFKSLGVDAAKLQIYGAVVMTPWALKPIFGVLSDIIALGHYHKRYWMIHSILIGTACAIVLCFVRQEVVLILLLFGVQYEIAWCDLLTEGAYAASMRKHPETGSNIVTLVNGFEKVGQIVGMTVVGPLSDEGLFFVTFIVGACVAWPSLAPLLRGWLPETQKHYHLNVDRFRADRGMLIVILFTGIGGPIMALLGATVPILYVSIGVGTACLIISLLGGFWAFPSMIARVALYLTLVRVSHIDMGSALDYFYTAPPECLPGGPAFSYKYYITYTGIIAACLSFVGVALYQLLFSTWRFRSVLIMTTLIHATGGLFDFILVQRWNENWGIPDHVFYILGNAIVSSVVFMLYWIPSSTLIAKVCPEGLEAATYAYLAGITNFAAMLSDLLGALMLRVFNVVTTESSTQNCDWSALPWLLLGGHILSIVCVGIPAAFLIPNTPQTAPLGVVDSDSATEIEFELLDEEKEEDE